ncbi:MAG: NAD(P)H-hydrate dehydratase [Candidatus Omnitrophota bacterium]|nr:NAD(P)H-hydrate dehydratase [Candidatus Omnitrophota bacterium]MBU1928406.1 NAD(P)H-hydrate dehydratase [Candidatus Omnitrophota bacterium]
MSRRKADTYKGDFGHIFVLAGSLKYSGAGVLCAEAALRSGAGLVTLGVPKGIAKAIIRIKAKEIMLLPLPENKDNTFALSGYPEICEFASGIDVLAVGPGIDRNKTTQALIRKIVSKINKPMVVDADGLNALVGHLNILQDACLPGRQVRVLTPHTGEMARLSGKNIGAVQKNRKEIAIKLSSDYNTTVVLKGRNTVVADQNGKFYLNKTGNPGMATAGSGDVLTGMIAAFLGQGLTAFQAAKFGVYLHGLAADMATRDKTQMAMIASDIITYIPAAIKKCS